jgi:biopolymer transport protein ExbB
VLATLGANAPFVGLFGTVLGIIQAFGELAQSSQQASTAVMASLAEALVATAVGLFVAIPAVVAFNAFSQRIRDAGSLADAVLEAILAGSAEAERKGA